MMSLLSAVIAVFTVMVSAGVQGSKVYETNWRLQFTTNVVASGHFRTVAVNKSAVCEIHCMASSTCQSFAVSSDKKTCWLYDHLVEFTNGGTAVPGILYFWRRFSRCPTELNYTLNAKVCYKLHETPHTWDGAKEQCRKDGATMFVGETRAKMNLIPNLFSFEQVWAGAFRDAVTGGWFYVDGTRLLTGTDLWQPSQPDLRIGSGQMQTVVRIAMDGKLDDIATSDYCRTACQIPML